MVALTMASMEPQNHTSVSDFYNGKTVFITGGTGFMGKVLLEKLLRACPGVGKIYLLIRPRKGQNAQERLQQLLSSPLFDLVRRDRPNDFNKVLPIQGDITQPELAISNTDRTLLFRTVNIVFHSAATVKFDEKLKLSVTINLVGTQRLIELCKKMPHIQAVVHVSTAYCNCDKDKVEEIVYQSPIEPDKIASVVESLDEHLVDELTEKLLGNRPNTYTFTKALAESWMQQNRGDLPLVIVRPSIVLCTIYGPFRGWVDNWNGPTGIIAAAGKGLFRTMLCEPDKTADLVPVDMVINLMVVAAWDIGVRRTKELPIYHCCTGIRKPITWYNFIDLCFQYMRKHPFSDINWYPDGTVTSSYFRTVFLRTFLHWVPAYIVDGITKLSGGKPILVRVQDKLCKAAKCLEYFTTHEWHFDDSNVQTLNLKLTPKDRVEFNFDVAQIQWNQYIEDYVLGIRRYIFKEDESSLPAARRQVSRMYWTYRIFQLISVLSAWYFLAMRCSSLRRAWTTALRFLMHMVRMIPFF